MNREQLIFLELLKSAVWDQSADVSVFGGIDLNGWTKVLRLSTLHRTNALIADGIQKLPELCRPPRELYLKTVFQAEEIERANHRINQALQEITAEYQQLNCPFILLKGQGLALNYPNPLHRTPGDLDLFLYREGDYEKLKEWVNARGYPQEAEGAVHHGFTRDCIHIENHRMIAGMEHPGYNNLLKTRVKEILASEKMITQKIGETEVRLLPPTLNAFFVFFHMFHHFVHLGVSTRQFCDWILLLSASKNSIDKGSFEALLDEFALRKAASVFANAAIRYLGAPPSVFPFELNKDNRYAELVMKDILDAGHFGFYRPGKKRPRAKWSGRWFSFQYTLKRTAKIFPVAPQHILILPLSKLVNRVKLTLLGDL